MIQEPVQPTGTENHPTRPTGGGGRRGKGWTGLIIVACLALAVPLIGAFAASSTSAPVTAVGASSAPASSAGPRLDGNGLKGNNGNGLKGNNGRGPKADKGLKGNGGQGKGPISITAVIGSDVSLKTEDGWTRTIAVTATTVITKGGKTIGTADLNVGDVIRFHQVRNADGTFIIDTINVPTPRTGGKVTAVDADSVTVMKGGATQVIAVTGSTVYTVGSAAGAKSDVKVGSEIEAQGTLSGTTFTATAIDVELPQIAGQVTVKTSDTITVKQRDGTTATIHLSATTRYRTKGDASAALTDIAVGDPISAAGTLRADGSIDAVSVHGKGAKADHQDDGDDAVVSPAPG